MAEINIEEINIEGFNIKEAFDKREVYNDLELFKINKRELELMQTVVTNIYDNTTPADNILTIERNDETPLSAFIINYLKPELNVDTLDAYLSQIKNKTMQDICRMEFTVNNKRIEHQTKMSDAQQRAVEIGRCNINEPEVIDATFKQCYKQLFNETMPNEALEGILNENNLNENNLNENNLNDFYAVLVLSTQSAFAAMVIMIATLNVDIIDPEKEFNLRGRKAGSYVVNVTSNETELYVVNNFYGEIYQVKDAVPIPYANVHAIIAANIRHSPNVSFTIEITPLPERAKKRKNLEKLNKLTGHSEPDRDATKPPTSLKAVGLLGEDPYKKKTLFRRMLGRGGKHTKRERKSKHKNRTRNKTRRRSYTFAHRKRP
jgi:hypothetical protein